VEKRQLGRTDLEVTACCLGTMTWGQQNTQAEAFEQMNYAIEQGINFFDTAELYSIPPNPDTQGSTETIIGNWFKSKNNRDQVILASKIVGRTDMNWHRRGFGDVKECRINKEQIDFAVEQSLKRLQTDYIDLYQLHWPDRPAGLFGNKMEFHELQAESENFQKTLEALQSHVDSGNIRHIGLSNETAYGVMRFIAESEKNDLPRVASIQNAYSLILRTFEQGLEEVAANEQVGLLAYSPLAQGYLTGKYRNGALPKGSRKELFGRMQRYESDQCLQAMDSYFKLAENQNVDVTQMALKFCDTRPFTTSTIIGATTMPQLETCIDAFDMKWTSDLEKQIQAIHEISPSPAI